MQKVRDTSRDTIAALATPVGESAIGVVRMSGRKTFEIADKIFRGKGNQIPSGAESFRALYGRIIHPESQEVIDEVLLLVLRSPHTYTCEDMVEISGHGSALSLQKILESLLQQGARLARPGEFTERAFLNGRIDLAQAEAVLDVIRSKTDGSFRSALDHLGGTFSKRVNAFREELLDCLAHIEGAIDFPDEDIEILGESELLKRLESLSEEIEGLLKGAATGIVFREGLTTVIAGRPNVGKSSLLNALLRQNRAIVTPIAGTTRDAIEELANIRGIPVRLVDTAGIRNPGNVVEAEGISRSRSYIRRADLVLLVMDGSEPATSEDEQLFEAISEKPAIVVVNKQDLPQRLDVEQLVQVINGKAIVRLSAVRGEGLDRLEETIGRMVWRGETRVSEGAWVTNVRHKEALEKAFVSLRCAKEQFAKRAPHEIIAVDLREALSALGEIVGEIFTEDLLDKIFSQFCIGK